MRRRKDKKKFKKNTEKRKNHNPPILYKKTKAWITGILMILVGVISFLSFFNQAGIAGRVFFDGFSFLIGKSIFLIPPLFLLGGILFLKKSRQRIYLPILLGIFILILGTSGMISIFQLVQTKGIADGINQLIIKEGGIMGFLMALPLEKTFGVEVTFIINLAVIIIGGLILIQFLLPEKDKIVFEKEPSFLSIRKILTPKFKIKEIPPLAGTSTSFPEEKRKTPEILVQSQTPENLLAKDLKVKPIEEKNKIIYQRPPLDLLESDHGKPSPGDIKSNSVVIKKTLQNFGIQVEMSEVNIGPTVTQYTFKPAEGVKLSRITALNNDLSLALASHPIRIEAPIPGRSLVGIEVPNKVRAQVRLRHLIAHPSFQNSPANLLLSLGRDVAGNPVFADLARMPHLLVAGSTGTGKTICLNNLISSLLYRNPPETLRFILVDPKRVEFPVYNQLPHLLTPVIFNVNQTINALKWLTSEMERRFDVLSEARTRDIAVYNEMMGREGQTMPYIVLIIDELADLMAARGRDIEAGVVRIAQMARAVGIHLIVATQRPSVEVITGLIKANITSRITFQVASQVDSRTILDMAGAEKLLGAGDMLYISSDVSKPKRIQAAYISEKEVKRVTNWIKKAEKPKGEIVEDLSESLEKTLTLPGETTETFSEEGEDPLFEEAKKVVIEAKKASASLLQRRLRVGYARAARLIDMMEEKGIVGPGEGAKPREVYIETEEEERSEM
ncbi:MAG TPA: DNA translocase FtsK [Candidatus Nealsonbacteria bacterium]|uniref:FtsK domain-containing protein n=1 Tax=marine sediment metagenome TaxID=412755 RepID=A0A0F9WZA7_9ZZZZ|nr:DNA translocase FtsK [Candidatus Nealsonbacteria bacterium]HEB46569.1 DNA translocase FtsK [Candidatus Nealsonbacteria bacterium]